MPNCLQNYFVIKSGLFEQPLKKSIFALSREIIIIARKKDCYERTQRLKQSFNINRLFLYYLMYTKPFLNHFLPKLPRLLTQSNAVDFRI